jgi:hypothetical protein
MMLINAEADRVWAWDCDVAPGPRHEADAPAHLHVCLYIDIMP